MHYLVDCLFFITTLATPFIIGFASPPPYRYLAFPSILLFFTYPILLQSIQQLQLFFSTHQEHYNQVSHHIVYNQDYNLTAGGLQNMHPFDASKYRRVLQQLINRKIIQKNQIHQVKSKPKRSVLRATMSFLYLIKLNYSICVSKYLELPLCFLPSFICRRLVLDRMLLASQGTVQATCISIHRGFAINLGGGFHHAKNTHGSGFCIYPDIMMALNQAKRHGILHPAIIDLDAHQGNGYQDDLLDEAQTKIIDFYNPDIYPGDYNAAKRITHPNYINRGTNDQEYLSQLGRALKLLDGVDFLIYNAGTDILVNDTLGGLKISQKGIIKRDEMVFKECIAKKIPIVMLLSGGYTKQSAIVIANSIQNLSNFINIAE